MAGRYVSEIELRTNIEKVLSQLKDTQDKVDKLDGKEYKVNLDIDTKTLESAIQKLDKMLDSLGKGTGDFKQLENLSKELSAITSEVKDFSKAFGKVDDSGAKTLLSSIQNIDKSLSELSQHILNVNKNMGNMGNNTSGAVKQVENIGNAASNAVKQVDKLAEAQSKLGNKTNISSGMKDAFPSTEATASVEKVIDGFKEVKQETEKATESAKEYVRTISQVGEWNVDSKVSVVKQRNDGQLETWNYDAKRGKKDITYDKYGNISYGDPIITTISNYKQLEKIIVKADDKLRDLQKTLKDTQNLNSNVSTKNIEDQIQYQKDYIQLLEQTVKAISQQDKYFLNEQQIIDARAKAKKEYDLNQGTKSDIFNAKQQVLENEQQALENQKEVIQRLNLALQDYSNIQEKIANGKGLIEDTKEAKRLLDVIYELQRSEFLPVDKLNESNRKLVEINKNAAETKNKLRQEDQNSVQSSVDKALKDQENAWKNIQSIREKLAETDDESKIVALKQQKEEYQQIYIEAWKVLKANSSLYDKEEQLAKLEKIRLNTNERISVYKNAKANLENAKNVQAEWDKNIKVIQDYMDAVTKLNNLKAKDKGTGSETNQIELQTKNVEELKQAAFKARQNLSSMQAENPDIIVWKQWVDMMDLFDQASKGSAESAAKLKDVLDNIKAPSYDKYENKLSSYQSKTSGYDATIKRFKDGGWTSPEYLKNVQAVNNAVKDYKNLLSEIKAKDGIASEEDIQKLNEYEGRIKETISTVKNMSAAEKGYDFTSGQKELDKIHKLLAENSRMSSEAKAKIKAFYREIESGNPSMSLNKIHGEILKIYNAEVEAGRAGKSMWAAIKEKAWYGAASAIGTYFGINDIFRYGGEAVQIVRELDTALTEMRKVSNESLQSLKNYQATTFDTADAVGTTAKQIQNSTADWMRLGESMDQAAESAEDSNVLLNVSEFEGIDEATESLVSMSQAYKDLDKMDIIDVLNNIGNNYSISTDGLATALKDSASALVTANNDLNEAVSLTTAGNAITQDPSKVGAGLRTISLRLVGTEEAKQELSDLGEETDGMITTASKLRDTIKNATKAASSDGKGFDIFDSNGNYKSTYEIMQGLADLYDDIVKKDKELGTNNLNLLLETIAGKNRANIAASILQNGDMLRSVYEDAQNSEGSAEQELNKYLDSIDGKMAQLENRAQEFWFKVIDSETIKSGIDLLTSLVKGATDLTDKIGVLSSLGGNINGTGGILGMLSGLVMNRFGVGERTKFQWQLYCAHPLKII